MPRDTISETTIRRREKAERKRVKAEKDNERKAKKIQDLTDIGTERSPACESCLSREVKCILFPPNYKFDSTSHPLRRCEFCYENKTNCVYDLKDADGKCNHCYANKMECTRRPKRMENLPSKQRTMPCLNCMKFNNKCSLPVDSKTSEVLNVPQAPRILGVKRHVFAVHTAPWYKSLSQGDQNKYKAEQIQVSGIPKSGRPCQRCVVRGLPCRVLNPNSKIAEFTRPSRCALCIVDESTAENISRSCTFNDDEITHAEHEASLPIFTGNVPLLWGHFGLEKPIPAPVKCTDNKSSTSITSPLENEIIIQYPLESAEVQERLDAIDRFVDYTLVALANENIIRDDCLPLSGPNIAQINDHDRNNRKSITTVSLLVNSLRIMNLSDIPDYFQSSSLEKLSMRTIFRALVSRFLLEAVFSRMPKDIEQFRDSIKLHLKGHPERIDDAVENYFCLRNNSTRFVDDPIRTGYGDLCYFPDNFTFQGIGKELVDVLLPLCLLSGKTRQEIVAACTSSCTEIAYLASELNLVIKARSRSPVTFYSPVRGDVVSEDNVRLFHDNGRQFGEVQITLLLGIKPAGNPSRPYAAARVELLRDGEA